MERIQSASKIIAGLAILLAGFSLAAGAQATNFKDSFDQPFINEKWQVLNDSADMRALDSGKLSVVAQPGRLSNGTTKNLLLLREPLKAENADIDLTLQVDIQRYGDSWDKRTLGGITLFSSKDDYLIFYVVNFRGAYKSDSGPRVFFAKRQGGKSTPNISKQIGKMKIGVSSFHLRVEKRGYKYTAWVSTNGGKKWQRVATYAVFNKALKPGLFAVRGNQADEAIFEFDEFSVSTSGKGASK